MFYGLIHDFYDDKVVIGFFVSFCFSLADMMDLLLEIGMLHLVLIVQFGRFHKYCHKIC